MPAPDIHPILYLHTTSEVGGSDVSMVRLIEGLDRTRFRAIVVLPSDGPLVPRLRDAGAEVLVVPTLLKLTSRRGWLYLVGFVLNMPRALWQLRTVIRRAHVALVHTNTIHNLYGGPVSWLTGTPHVWHIREIVWQKGWLRRMELWMARHMATRIIVTSDAVAAMFGAVETRPATLRKVSNGIEVERFHPDAVPGQREHMRASLGAGADDILVGIAGRLDVWKGVDVFLEAAARVASGCPRVRFVVVGGPVIGLETYATSLKARATTLGLEGRLVWTDWAFSPDAMPDVHRALDVLVLPSTEPEPFGLVVVEAMATARPVIATEHGGPCEIVVDGVTGLLVPPNDPDALASAIRRVCDDPALAQAMGAAGRARVIERYSSTAYLAGVHRVYDEILPGSNR